MPSLRLVMGSRRADGEEEPAPNMPLVFDEDETDETWGNERPRSKRLRPSVPDTSEEDEPMQIEESPKPAPKPKGRGRKSAKAVASFESSRAASMDVDSESGAPRAGPSRSSLPHIPNGPGPKRDHRTVEGRTFFIEDDELRLEDDVKGDTKIDARGHLQGGREMSTATFASPHRPDPDKLYILAIDACRAVGFRDSVLFFKRNPLLYKIIVLQPEKDELIEEGRLHPNLRHRQVTMITARNFYKLFGARVVIGGHYVKDDYYEDAARLSGFKEDQRAIVELYDPEIDTGTLAFAKRPEQRHTKTGYGGDVPRTRPPKNNAPSKTLASIAPSMHLPRDQKYGGSGISPFKAYDPNSKARKPAAGLTVENWIFQYARAVTQANREIQTWREGHARPIGLNATVAEQMAAAQADDAEREAEEAAIAKRPANGTTDAAPKRRRARSPTRGIFDLHTAVPHVRAELQATQAKLELVDEVPDIDGATLALAKEGFATVSHEYGLETVQRIVEPAFAVPNVWRFRPEDVEASA